MEKEDIEKLINKEKFTWKNLLFNKWAIDFYMKLKFTKWNYYCFTKNILPHFYFNGRKIL